MEKLEMRARARAAARAAGLFELGRPLDDRDDARGRAAAPGRTPPPVDAIDEAHARAACRPMGELEFVVQAADARGRVRSLYVIVPDLALKPHYQRLGFEVVPGSRVLLDAESLSPIAVLRLSERSGGAMPERNGSSAGFNPYFDIPPA